MPVPTKPKKIKTKNYIVIGTCHMGMDNDVLRVIAAVAKDMNAQVVHTGSLASATEIAMYKRRVRKCQTWDKAKEERLKRKEEFTARSLAQIEKKLLQVEEAYSEEESEYRIAQLERQAEKLQERAEKLTEEELLYHQRLGEDTDRLYAEMKELEEIQKARIDNLVAHFPNIKFVCNDEIAIPGHEEYLEDRYVHYTMPVSPYINITSVPANGDKVAQQPVTMRTFRLLKEVGASHIIAHMTPQSKPYAKTGLNDVYMYVTTGCLQRCDLPGKVSDAYKTSSRPSCVLLSIDEKTGHYHHQRLLVKHINHTSIKKKIPHIIYDGVVWNSAGEKIELQAEDKATGTTDMHAPHESLGVVGALRGLNCLMQPGEFIDLGDTADYSSVSPHAKNRPQDVENLRLKDDLFYVYRLLHALSNESEFPSIEKRTLIDSNHAEWISRKIAEQPYLDGLLDWKTLANTIFQKWQVLVRGAGASVFYKFGDLTIRHADGEQTVTKAHDVYGNYIGGHHHSLQEFLEAVFSGPGCLLGPKYLNNRETAWQNCIISMSKFKGYTTKHPKVVLHNEHKKTSRFAFKGQIYEVPFHRYDPSGDQAVKESVQKALLSGIFL